MHDVALLGADLQEKDLVVELGPWLDPLVHPDLGVPLWAAFQVLERSYTPTARNPETSRLSLGNL